METDTPTQQPVVTLRRHANRLIWIVVGVACSVLIFGWLLDNEFFVRLFTGFPAMVPATAVTIILAGIGSLSTGKPPGLVRPVACAALILLIVLLEEAGPLDLISHSAEDDMSPASAFAAFLVAVSLCLLADRVPHLRTFRTTTDTIGLSLTCIPLLGYLFSSEALWGNVIYTKMSLHTALCFFMLFAARLMLEAERNWISVLYADQSGSKMARSILPVVTLGPVVLCALALWATHKAVVTPDFRLTILAFAVVAIGTFAVISVADRINALERDADKIQQQLKQRDLDVLRSQKIAVLGQLVGGVAHDFNNILAVIMGNLELLEEDEDDPVNKGYIEQAIEAANHAAALTSQLLAYGRKSRLDPERVFIDAAVTEALSMFRRVSGTGLSISTNLGARGAIAHLDRANIAQVLLNILINARDAMPEGGTITATTRIEAAGPPPPPDGIIDTPPAEGPHIAIELRDTGIGMDVETVERVTEPYFTTKGVGEGSGLGLSMAQGFCHQSKGALRIESTEGQGTTVTLYFPLMDVDKNAPAVVVPTRTRRPARSSSLIMIVDDEDGVTRVMSRQLERDGYTVVTAGNSDEALAMLDAGTVPQLVISDIIMPGRLQGHQLAVLIRQLWPGVKILLMSGYQSNRLRDQYAIAGQIEFLQKPISRATLRQAVALVINSEE